ncbi:MAG: hypothetical protein KBT03_11270 [Bacteroidales bacterium]|nr:hypothetical protein [Candidatus Scybalousia scybalohippi]
MELRIRFKTGDDVVVKNFQTIEAEGNYEKKTFNDVKVYVNEETGFVIFPDFDYFEQKMKITSIDTQDTMPYFTDSGIWLPDDLLWSTKEYEDYQEKEAKRIADDMVKKQNDDKVRFELDKKIKKKINNRIFPDNLDDDPVAEVKANAAEWKENVVNIDRMQQNRMNVNFVNLDDFAVDDRDDNNPVPAGGILDEMLADRNEEGPAPVPVPDAPQIQENPIINRFNGKPFGKLFIKLIKIEPKIKEFSDTSFSHLKRHELEFIMNMLNTRFDVGVNYANMTQKEMANWCYVYVRDNM